MDSAASNFRVLLCYLMRSLRVLVHYSRASSVRCAGLLRRTHLDKVETYFRARLGRDLGPKKPFGCGSMFSSYIKRKQRHPLNWILYRLWLLEGTSSRGGWNDTLQQAALSMPEATSTGGNKNHTDRHLKSNCKHCVIDRLKAFVGCNDKRQKRT